MDASTELRRTIRVLRKMWPASQAKQLDHYEQAIGFAAERWAEAEPVDAQPLAVSFAQGGKGETT